MPAAPDGPGHPPVRTDRWVRAAGAPLRGPGGRLLLVAAVVAVSLASLSAFQSWRAYDRDRESVIDAAQELARAGAADAERFLEGRLDLLAVMAAAPVVSSGDLGAIHGYLTSVRPGELGFSSGMGLVDAQGQLVASTGLDVGAPPIDLTVQPFVTAVLATAQPFISAAIMLPGDGAWVIALAVPKRDAAGTVTGVFFGAIGLDWLRATAAGQPYGDDAILQIVDRDGQLIVAPGATEIRDVQTAGIVGRSRAQEDDPAASGVLVDVAGLTGEPDRLVAYANVPVAGWTLLVDRPRGAAFGNAFRDLVVELLAVGAVVLLALAGATRAGARLNRLAAAERAATAALRESEGRFRTLATDTPVGIFRTDAAGNTVYVNPAWSAITGLDLATAAGLGWLGALHPDDRERIGSGWKAASAAGRPEEGEYRFVTPAGATVWVTGRANPERDVAGNLAGYVGTISDITERKRAEELRRSFLDGLAHDLKNPLSTVKAQAQLLRRRLNRGGPSDSAALDGGLSAIDIAATRMTRLIDEMLSAAREESDRPVTLDRSPVDLIALAQGCIAEQRLATDRHAITLVTESSEPIVGHWDRARLERAIANLLGNAVKYSPLGGEITVVAGEERDPAGDWAILTVRDSGLGIPAADLPRVFDRYHRGANVSAWTAGSGLGLAGVLQAIEQHGGAVAVESEEGYGSVFTIRLPLGGGAA